MGIVPSRLSRWLDTSLRNRVAFVMVSISTAAASILAAVSFLASHRLITENTLQTHNAALATLDRQLGFETRSLAKMLEAMASNSFISNALVDSLGRDQYLVPFLHDQKFPGSWNGSLWLVDFQGQVVGGNAPNAQFTYGNVAAVRTALATGHQQVTPIANSNRLVFVSPVVFPPTGSVEGAVVAVVDLATVLAQSTEFLRADDCFRVVFASHSVLLPASCDIGGRMPDLSKDLALGKPFEQLGLRVELFGGTRVQSLTVATYLAGFVMVIVCVFLAVLWASRRMSERIVEPLAKLTEVADTVVSQDCLDVRVPLAGSDEIGRLANSFNHMVESLQQAQARMREDMAQLTRADNELQMLNAQLETRVATRTADLQRTIENLNGARDQLIQSEKLAALGRLVAGVAHELNTPIGNSLLVASHFQDGTVQLIEASKAGIRRSEFQRFLADGVRSMELLISNLRRAADLISSFKRVAVDQTSAQRRRFNLAEVVAENVRTLQAAMKKSPFTIEQDIPTDIQMDSYPGPLGQVLVNLITNAISHGFEGAENGIIHIEAQRTDSSNISLVVRDNGQGIAPEHAKHILEPFFTTKLGQGGSGLGLNIVHNIVTGVLGGKLEIDSAPGSGTTVSLNLPEVAPSPSSADERAEAVA